VPPSAAVRLRRRKPSQPRTQRAWRA
jgi:hypothetical protein